MLTEGSLKAKEEGANGNLQDGNGSSGPLPHPLSRGWQKSYFDKTMEKRSGKECGLGRTASLAGHLHKEKRQEKDKEEKNRLNQGRASN